jgi:hypothetical protein
VIDVYGDHAVTCRRSNFYARHRQVAEALASVLVSCDVCIEKEVAVSGAERPADILARRLDGGRSTAIDITVVHPLTSFDSAQGGDRIEEAEKAKHRHYDTLCTQAGLAFNAFGVSTLGGAGPDACRILKLINSHIMQKFGTKEGMQLCRQAHERIIVACMRAVGAQLLQFSGMSEEALEPPKKQPNFPVQDQPGPCADMPPGISEQAENVGEDQASSNALRWAIFSFVQHAFPERATPITDALLLLSTSTLHGYMVNPSALYQQAMRISDALPVEALQNRGNYGHPPLAIMDVDEVGAGS